MLTYIVFLSPETQTQMIVTLARKPLLTNCSVSGTVLQTGGGALNIDGCRIGVDQIWSSGKAGQDLSARHQRHDSRPYTDGLSGVGYKPSVHTGRWPANLILEHRAGCRHDGIKQIQDKHGGTTIAMNVSKQGAVYGLGHRAQAHYRHHDPNGCEQVAAWVCEPDCPVAELDRMSGTNTVSVRQPTGSKLYGGMALFERETRDTVVRGHADTGTASRYFKQVQ